MTNTKREEGRHEEAMPAIGEGETGASGQGAAGSRATTAASQRVPGYLVTNDTAVDLRDGRDLRPTQHADTATKAMIEICHN